MTKISVIMGVYNSKNLELLSLSIQSVLNQTYKDFEFIICNDASTDPQISLLLNEIARHDSRIILLQNERNCGLAQTLNNCLKVASGEYIARQDDDDISLPERFQTEINFLENNKEFVLVGCNLFLFDDNGVWGMRKHTEFPQKTDFLFGSQFPHPATLIKADVLNEIGAYTVSKITRRTEDYDLYMRLYYFGYRGANLQIPLYKYYETDITYKQQKLSHRIDEAKLKKYWFRKLKLYPKGLIYILKPILSGLAPLVIRRKRKRKIYSKELEKYIAMQSESR